MQAVTSSIAASTGHAALESIDHLTQKVCLLWGTPELNVFVRRLFLDSRNGSRQGLPREIAAEVVFLAETNTLVRAIQRSQKLGIRFDDALKSVEMEDDTHVKFDAFDDPRVSRDTLVRSEKKHYMWATHTMGIRYSQSQPDAGQASGLFAFLLMPFRSKWFWVAVFLFVGYQFIWPRAQALL